MVGTDGGSKIADTPTDEAIIAMGEALIGLADDHV